MWFSAIVGKEEVGDVAGGDSDNINTDDTAAPAQASPNSQSSSQPESSSAPASASEAAAAALPPIHFNSRRSPIYCTKACVATSQPLATSIGLHILRGCGGNAADASVAIAAALAVVSFVGVVLQYLQTAIKSTTCIYFSLVPLSFDHSLNHAVQVWAGICLPCGTMLLKNKYLPSMGVAVVPRI